MIKTFLWAVFAGTGTIAAFLLPVHIIAFALGYQMRFDNWFFQIYFVVLLFSALYHGLYRLRTILFDLGILKKE